MVAKVAEKYFLNVNLDEWRGRSSFTFLVDSHRLLEIYDCKKGVL